MTSGETEQFYPKNKKQWRNWLLKNHDKKDRVQLIQFKKAANQPTITWSEAVDEALCFGWIDSTRRSLDTERSIQLFSRRKPKSTWSKINKEKISKMTAEGKMHESGLLSVAIAKENGSWNILDSVEDLVIPEDLDKAISARKAAMEYFQSLSKSTRKAILQWVILAKRPETRNKRIKEIVDLAAKKQKPKQF